MPSLRQTSSTPPPASTSLTASTICSSVYLLLRMGPPSRGLTHQTVQFPGGRSGELSKVGTHAERAVVECDRSHLSAGRRQDAAGRQLKVDVDPDGGCGEECGFYPGPSRARA